MVRVLCVNRLSHRLTHVNGADRANVVARKPLERAKLLSMYSVHDS